jgi:mannose/cellobiose epimerase-like protein (N-acyl-D-glucosamine 2-epimerase family)
MTQGRQALLHVETQQFINWCRHDLLPLWMRQGVDRGSGGFYEQLHFDGTPDTHATRRIRVSARQIYAFSHASMLGWIDARALVNWSVDYLVDTALCADGEPGFAHLLDADGVICDAKRDLYDHAFHILALSWAYRATKDSQMLNLAKDTLAFVDEAMGAPNGGWNEGLPAVLPRRQNPHMHMLEALLGLYEASGDPEYLRRADTVIALLEEHFIDNKTGLLFEYFNAALTPVEPQAVEPGHMAEWCWLLHYRARLSEEPTGELAQQMGQRADQYGAKGDGFLIDAYDAHENVLVPSRRLWGQSEWLKSMFVRLRGDDTDIEANAASLLQRIKSSYLDVNVPGLWTDQFDLNGGSIATHVPASIVYHLVSAAAEAERVLNMP